MPKQQQQQRSDICAQGKEKEREKEKQWNCTPILTHRNPRVFFTTAHRSVSTESAFFGGEKKMMQSPRWCALPPHITKRQQKKKKKQGAPVHYEGYDSFVFVHRQTVLARINKRGLKEDENCVYAQKKKWKFWETQTRYTVSIHSCFFSPLFFWLSTVHLILFFFFFSLAAQTHSTVESQKTTASGRRMWYSEWLGGKRRTDGTT